MQKPDTIEIAKKQRHLYLLGKVKANRPLTRAEIDELAKYEGQELSRASSIEHQDNSDYVATQKAAAEYAGKTVRTIRRWVEEKKVKKTKAGYKKSELDTAKEAKPKSETADRTEKAEADYKETKAKLAAIELKLRQGKFLPIEEVESGRLARIQAVKRALLGMPRKIAPQLEGKTAKQIYSILDVEARHIINVFARGMEPIDAMSMDKCRASGVEAAGKNHRK